MAQEVRPRPPVSLLATDGRRHPAQQAMVAVTVVLGALAFVTAMFPGLHLVSSWAGLVGILTAAYGLYISATTRERFPLMLGLGASAIGLFLGMAHGGPFGGVVG